MLDNYKLPHHDIIDGSLSVVFRGVAAAVASLNGSRGQRPDIPEADREATYRHLARHYEQFEEDAPPLKSIKEIDETVRQTTLRDVLGYLPTANPEDLDTIRSYLASDEERREVNDMAELLE
jgi:hypothetical protein